MKMKRMPSKKEKWIDSLQLPKDVCMGALRVTLTGNSEAWIENYRGILEYTGERILLQDYYTNEDMKISGNISALRYLRE